MSLGKVWVYLTAATVIGAVVLGIQHSAAVSQEAYSGLLDFFLAVASIIFAMIGAWIVLMYSSSMHDYLISNSQKIKDEAYQLGASVDDYARDVVDAARQTEESLAKLTDALWISLAVLVLVIVTKTLIALSGLFAPIHESVIFVAELLALASVPLILSSLVYAVIIIALTNLAVLKSVQKANAKFRARIKSG